MSLLQGHIREVDVTELSLFDSYAFRWRLSETTGTKTMDVATLDVVLQSAESSWALEESAGWFDIDTKPDHASLAMMADLFGDPPFLSHLQAYKVILPSKDGYWCRKNLITQRLNGCVSAKLVKDFALPRQHYRAPRYEAIDRSSLWNLLPIALGIIQMHDSVSVASLIQDLGVLESELANRLSSPLLLDQPMHRQRLAILHGRPDWSITEGIYRAAHELDIGVYILDAPGHWMQDGPYTIFREGFIPIDITLNDSLPARVVDALRNYPVRMDGLISFSDMYLIPAAHAARALGLPTAHPSILETCRDKYLTRMIQLPQDFQCMRVDGYQGLLELLDGLEPDQALKYPLIVKPCAGYGSEGVAKVHNLAELLVASKDANKTDYGRGNLIAIETYIDGPEVDANFVLWNGQPLFFEISDQFPAEADSDSPTSTPNFLELDLVLPTRLPAREQTAIKETLLSILGKLGCRNGVFHMEARMRSSAMEYRVTQNGIIDLVHRTGADPQQVSAAIIESNCRPPAIVCTYATAYTYGVDYYALHHLIALGDAERVRALATPFLSGPQCHSDVINVPVRKGGIFATRDAVGDFSRHHPELMKNVVRAVFFFNYGDEVPDPSSGILTFIGSFLIASHVSRVELLRNADQIRDKFHYKLVSSRDDLDIMPDGVGLN